MENSLKVQNVMGKGGGSEFGDLKLPARGTKGWLEFTVIKTY